MRWVLAAALLLGGPWAAGAQAPAASNDGQKAALRTAGGDTPAKPFVWDVPGLVSTVDVAGTMEAMGVPMKLQAATSTRRPRELFEHFARLFDGAGFYIPPPRHQLVVHGALTLTAMDVDRKLVYTVMLRLNPDGKTTKVLLGTSNMGLAKKPQAVAFAPLYPGARKVLTSNVEVGRSVAYVAKATPQELADFYGKVMEEAGYREQSPGLYTKGREQVQVLARPQGDGELSVLVIGRIGTAEEFITNPHTD